MAVAVRRNPTPPARSTSRLVISWWCRVFLTAPRFFCVPSVGAGGLYRWWGVPDGGVSPDGGVWPGWWCTPDGGACTGGGVALLDDAGVPNGGKAQRWIALSADPMCTFTSLQGVGVRGARPKRVSRRRRPGAGLLEVRRPLGNASSNKPPSRLAPPSCWRSGGFYAAQPPTTRLRRACLGQRAVEIGLEPVGIGAVDRVAGQDWDLGGVVGDLVAD